MITPEEAKQALIADDHFVAKTGWIKSYITRLSIDNDGKPIPWYTYSSMKFIDKRLNKDMSVFEYGCGHSTLWYGERVARVIAVEEKPAWFDKIRQDIKANTEIVLAQGKEYINHISTIPKLFDVICIDGEDRVKCCMAGIISLKAKGVIIWDNSGTPADQECYNYLYSLGFKKLDFYGLTPICTYDNCTSIFYREDNCFNI